jgi:hypothetical protein
MFTVWCVFLLFAFSAILGVSKNCTFPTVFGVAFIFSCNGNSLKKEFFLIIFFCVDMLGDIFLCVTDAPLNPLFACVAGQSFERIESAHELLADGALTTEVTRVRRWLIVGVAPRSDWARVEIVRSPYDGFRIGLNGTTVFVFVSCVQGLD